MSEDYPFWSNALYDLILSSDPMHDTRSMLITTFISILLVLMSVVVVWKANKRIKILKDSANLNPYGISVYSLRIYLFIKMFCLANIAVNVTNVLLTWIISTFFAHSYIANHSYSIVLGVLIQVRGLILLIVNLDILFEFLSLLHLMWIEKGKDLGKLVYLAKTADSSVLEKRRILKQERMIEIVWLGLALLALV